AAGGERAGRGPVRAAAWCGAGVAQRARAEPFLLTYSARARAGGRAEDSPAALWRLLGLPLEITLLDGLAGVRVEWMGKPLAGAEVTLLAPGQKDAVERKTNQDGVVALDKATAAGLYALRARHTPGQAGDGGGA